MVLLEGVGPLLVGPLVAVPPIARTLVWARRLDSFRGTGPLRKKKTAQVASARRLTLAAGRAHDPLDARRGASKPLLPTRPALLEGLLAALACAACSHEVERFYPDGVLRSSGSVYGAQQLPDGLWKTWYPGGEPREEGRYERGRRVGVWTQWWPNGQRRSRGTRAFDEALQASPREGAWTFWHANGVRAAQGVYHKGLREGRWDVSLEDGTLDGDRSGEFHADAKIGG